MYGFDRNVEKFSNHLKLQLLYAFYHKKGLLILHSVKWLGASANMYLSL